MIDILAATTLATAVIISIRSTTDMLEEFVVVSLVVEVTHRAKCQLLALGGLTPLRDETATLAGQCLPGPGSINPKKRWNKIVSLYIMFATCGSFSHRTK